MGLILKNVCLEKQARHKNCVGMFRIFTFTRALKVDYLMLSLFLDFTDTLRQSSSFELISCNDPYLLKFKIYW